MTRVKPLSDVQPNSTNAPAGPERAANARHGRRAHHESSAASRARHKQGPRLEPDPGDVVACRSLRGLASLFGSLLQIRAFDVEGITLGRATCVEGTLCDQLVPTGSSCAVVAVTTLHLGPHVGIEIFAQGELVAAGDFIQKERGVGEVRCPLKDLTRQEFERVGARPGSFFLRIPMTDDEAAEVARDINAQLKTRSPFRWLTKACSHWLESVLGEKRVGGARLPFAAAIASGGSADLLVVRDLDGELWLWDLTTCDNHTYVSVLGRGTLSCSRAERTLAWPTV